MSIRPNRISCYILLKLSKETSLSLHWRTRQKFTWITKGDMTEKIKKIYEAMADKTLSFGCIIQTWDTYFVVQSYDETDNNYIHIWKIQYLPDNKKKIGIQINTNLIKMQSVWFEIIGHPVMIGVILEHIEKNKINTVCFELTEEILFLWEDKTKPIEDQS